MEAARGRVLLVDDDVPVCRMLVRLLRDEHEVLVTTDGLDALEMLEAGERFDAIISDINMPSLSGADLQRAVMRFAPEQVDRLIFLTGDSSSALAAQVRSNLVLDKVEHLHLLKSLVARVVTASRDGYFPERKRLRYRP